MADSKVIKCECKNEFQDKEYGEGNRLHTISEDGKTAYCTVCSPSNRRDKSSSRPSRKGKIIK